MQEKLKNRPAREILEDFAKNLGLEVSVERFDKPGTPICLSLKSSISYVYFLDKDRFGITFSSWGFDETDVADNALDLILSASMIYWLVPGENVSNFAGVDLSSICTVEELEIALDLGSLRRSSRQYLASDKDLLSKQIW